MSLQTDTVTELEAEIQSSLNAATMSILPSPTAPNKRTIVSDSSVPKSPKTARANSTTSSTTTTSIVETSKPDTPIGLFFKSVLPTVELALQQNETVNIFSDDFETLNEDEVLLGDKSNNYLKEFQSFTDFEFSKDKAISSLDWSPSGKGIVAVSCADKMDLDTRLQALRKVNSSVILIWNFVDPIHPQVCKTIIPAL
jgi:hypothetical protein